MHLSAWGASTGRTQGDPAGLARSGGPAPSLSSFSSCPAPSPMSADSPDSPVAVFCPRLPPSFFAWLAPRPSAFPVSSPAPCPLCVVSPPWSLTLVAGGLSPAWPLCRRPSSRGPAGRGVGHALTGRGGGPFASSAYRRAHQHTDRPHLHTLCGAPGAHSQVSRQAPPSPVLASLARERPHPPPLSGSGSFCLPGSSRTCWARALPFLPAQSPPSAAGRHPIPSHCAGSFLLRPGGHRRGQRAAPHPWLPPHPRAPAPRG